MFRNRIENDNDKGFDLLWAGPNATNIPEEATLVESSNQDIQLTNPSEWKNTDDLRFYRRNTLYTNSGGASLKYTFEGVAIWFYGSVDKPHGFYTVSLDGSKPERLSGTNPTGQLTQQMLWSKIGLTPGRHTFTLTQDDDNGKYVNLNYFRCGVSNFSAVGESKHRSLLLIRVLRNEDASALPASAFTTSSVSPTSMTPTSAPFPSTSNQSTVFLAVGLSVGVLLLGATILFAFLYIRRKRRNARPREVDAPLSTPHFAIPSTTWLIVRKRALPKSNHHMRNQPEASEISSSGPDTLGSPGPTSMGPPPSYESHFPN